MLIEVTILLANSNVVDRHSRLSPMKRYHPSPWVGSFWRLHREKHDEFAYLGYMPHI